jgi:hypothetical protein
MFLTREPHKFLYPKQCVHCGLPKWSMPNDSAIDGQLRPGASGPSEL